MNIHLTCSSPYCKRNGGKDTPEMAFCDCVANIDLPRLPTCFRRFLREEFEKKNARIAKKIIEHNWKKSNTIYIKKLNETLAADAEEAAWERGTLWYFITISPEPGTDIQSFLKMAHKYMARRIHSECEFVIEQRGEELTDLNLTEFPPKIGEGIHAHFLAKRNLLYPPSKYLKNTINSWKCCCNVWNGANILAPGCPIYLEPLPYKPEILAQAKGYMKGHKNKFKLSKVAGDKIFRKKHNIASWYSRDLIVHK